MQYQVRPAAIGACRMSKWLSWSLLLNALANSKLVVVYIRAAFARFNVLHTAVDHM